jgi:DNA-binding NtrC family response regulator
MPEPPSDDSGPIEREETFASGFWNIKTARFIVAPGEQASPRRLSLVIYHLEGVEVIPLVEGQPLLVGRQGSVDVCIGDKTLSRRHARFLLDNGEVEVEDQGSTNGTWVNGERIKRALIRVTDDIALGSVGVSLHATTPATARFGFDSHERFEVLLQHEVERARLFSRTVSLLMVEASRGKRLGRWCDRIRRMLRPVDRIALYGRGTVEVLLPEATVEQTQRLARAIVKEPATDEPPLRCGVAICPDIATSAEELLEVCRAALLSASAKQPVQTASAERAVVPEVEVGEGPVISSPAMLELFDTIDRVAKAAIPVLIVGETGTGKEVIARALHERSDRRERPLRSVNCGAIPEQLLESTLFGHKKGAFTGADRDAPGMFVTAAGGTLLLDEIGELSASAQAALLRVIETKTVVPVGDTRETKVNVRIIAATHRNLEQMCEENAFRWDLLYRLNTMVLEVPPLRERPEEIRPLALHFLGLTRALDTGGVQAREINEEAMRALTSFDWPGNVRQLRNVIERAAVVAEGPTITLGDLPERIRMVREGPQAPEPVVAIPHRVLDRTDRMRIVSPDTGAPVSAEGEDLEEEGLKEQVARFECLLIEDALHRTEGNQSAAAELLQMPRRTLAYRISTLGVDPSGAYAEPLPEEVSRDSSLPYKDRVERFEAGLLREALASAGGAAAEAARLLDMTSKAFSYKARKYGLK